MSRSWVSIRRAAVGALTCAYGLALLVVLVGLAPVVLLGKLVLIACPRPPVVRDAARLLLLAAAFLALFELPALLATVGRRPGTRDHHQRLAAALNARLVAGGFAFAALRVCVTGPVPPAPALPRGPVIVFARHAGAFNTHLVWHLINRDLCRSPRTVAKRLVAFLPGLERLLSGAGITFINWTSRGKVTALRTLERMSRDVGPDEALLLFVEGRNYTAGRRAAAIAALRAKGRHLKAACAARLSHVLAPEPNGAWALVTGRPDADVLILAHTGLEDLVAAGRRHSHPARLDGTVYAAWWHVPAAKVPREAAAFRGWLQARWQAADDWITTVRDHRAVADTVPPVALPVRMR